ncbi:MAG: LysR family transcriptional regulator [Deltaproteobacteria bacterium]|nr:LysR family transcriptional regulator [Deltaproteobacteria bacterium]MBW2360769.1 LysR family transcriptional regulator [Deltaproteobacteria bacterium]
MDLNLLVALEALLAERNVTRAAARVGLSQPAMSRALGRLRELLEDPILIRSGHRMVPTARALAAEEPLERALEAIGAALAPEPEFDPARTRRSFAMGCLDTTQVVVLPRLLERLAREAPGLDVETRSLVSNRETVAELAVGQLDLAIGRFDATPPGFHSAPLYSDRVVCLVRRGHPRIRRHLSLKRYLAEAHLATETVSHSDLPFTVEALLAQQGYARRVACTIGSLATAPLIVSRTDLVCTAVSRTIEPFAKGLGVRTFPPPFDAPAIELRVVWHERAVGDRGHAWLRATLLDLFGTQSGGTSTRS